MKPAAGRLLITAFLFVGWLAYLGYLVATRPISDGKLVVLSRPQALVSDLDVIAHLDGIKQPEVEVREVLYQGPGKPVPPGATIKVRNLAFCDGFTSPGAYLLLLQGQGDDQYDVAPTPSSPGYQENERRPQIYPAREALPQYRQVHKPAPGRPVE
jgi:hypothetical protein